MQAEIEFQKKVDAVAVHTGVSKALRDAGLDVSVIIATCGRTEGLDATLAACEEYLDAGFDWELLLLFNGCARAHAEAYCDRGIAAHLPVHGYHLASGGKTHALNAAIERARGRLLVFTDDDLLHEPGWLSELWRAYCRWGDEAIFGGRILPLFPENTPAWIKDERYVSQEQAFALYDFGAREQEVNAAPFGPNMAASRALIGTHRFDTRLGPGSESGVGMSDETEFGRRLQAAGGRLVYVPTAEVRHVIRPEQLQTDWLLARAYIYGKAKAARRLTAPTGEQAGARQIARLLAKSRRKLLSVRLRVWLTLGLSRRWRFRLRWRQQLRRGFIEGLASARREA